MIEVSSNKTKCNIRNETGGGQWETEEQKDLYLQVISAFDHAYELFNEYKKKYGTDKNGINKIVKTLNGGL